MVARPHPSINTKLAGPKVCQKKELLSNRSLVELEAMCGTYFVPEVHLDNPEYAPDSAVARDYSLWLSSGDPAILRRAYKEMDQGWASRDVTSASGSSSIRSTWIALPLLPVLRDRWQPGFWPWWEWCWSPNATPTNVKSSGEEPFQCNGSSNK